jgi:monothiol glutaredoxin
MSSRALDFIESFIKKNHTALFMKGNKEQPQCGFSRQVVDALNTLTHDYETFDVLSDPEIREAIKKYSSWPTIPQLYIGGEFIGGCDITLDLMAKGQLATLLKVPKCTQAPSIKLTPSAQGAFQRAIADSASPNEVVRVVVPANFEHELSFDQAGPQDFLIKLGDITLAIDPYSAARAANLSIDYVEDKLDGGFAFQNPNCPPPVQEISAQELKDWHDTGKPLLLIDARPEEERKLAHIDFAKPLSSFGPDDLAKIEKEAVVVFHCHHGGRSKRLAEKWRLRGFTKLYNLTGGIAAWSQMVDKNVPNY